MKITIGNLRKLIRESWADPFSDLNWQGRSDHPVYSYIPTAEEQAAVGIYKLPEKIHPGLEKLNEDAREFLQYVSNVLQKATKIADADISINKSMLFNMAESVHATSTFFGKTMGFVTVKGNYTQFIRTAEKFVNAAKVISNEVANEVSNDTKLNKLISSFKTSVETITTLFEEIKKKFEEWKLEIDFDKASKKEINGIQ